MRSLFGVALGVLALSAGQVAAAVPVAKATPPAKASKASPAAKKAVTGDPTPQTVAGMATWVRISGDNFGKPFAIIDKVGAKIFVYGKDGDLIGAAPALLGSTRGDFSTPGVGDREMSDISPDERTTPAGRFQAKYGPAADGKKVLWVDYGTAISMHPVVTAKPAERRPQRLASATAEDNRITFGCINVSAAFYEKVISKNFTAAGGIVYILPETKTLAEVFPTFPLDSLVAETPPILNASVQGAAGSGGAAKLRTAVKSDGPLPGETYRPGPRE